MRMPRPIVRTMSRLTSMLGAVALATWALAATAIPVIELDARQVELLALRTTPATAATALAVDGLLGSIELPLEGTVAIASAMMMGDSPGPVIAAIASPKRIAGKDSSTSMTRMSSPSMRR